ncbi:MAG: hypothetical protein L0323_11605 [Planctomycetes bacterium]|nr:hypothetical protein [Planctomycetota bacterium]
MRCRQEDLRSIAAPALIGIRDADIVRPERAVRVFRSLPRARPGALPMRSDLPLSILPAFLDAPVTAPERPK